VPIASIDDTEPMVIALNNLPAMRADKGIVMVKSAGNAFRGFSVPGPQGEAVDSGQCGPARKYGLTCQNAAFNFESLLPQVITVGAVNARGVRASYSSAGASLLVSGLGGEYGSAEPRFLQEAGPAVMTTDLAGCERGYARYNPFSPFGNEFEDPRSAVARELNANCDYTSVMNGTSAAAPTVTGVVALMLSVNPELTWRDLRLILARSARRIDAERAALSLPLAGGSYVAEPGWSKNGAGLWFHDWYGFGLVDAAAAVAMAKATSQHLTGPMQDSGWIDAHDVSPHGLPAAVPVANPAGAASSIAFDAARTIEAVQVRVAIGGDALLGDLGIELVSPSGMRSMLMTAHNAFQNTKAVAELPLMSNAFNDENAKGEWTLRVVDVNGRGDANRQAMLENWSLRILGR
jgi:subtilisin family serine protease